MLKQNSDGKESL